MDHFSGLIKIVLVGLFFSCVLQLQAQDITNLVKKEPFKFSGNLSMGGSMFRTSQNLNDRSPLSYYVQGNSTFSFYGFKVPVTLSFRDSRLNFSKQINRIGIRPKYKWAQIYFGANRYQFSPYTLSGQNINGIGVQLTPGNFRFTAMRGTMQNLLPQVDSLVYGTALIPIYQRKAFGTKLGYNSSKGDIELMLFKAKDQLDPPVAIVDTLRDILTPEENIVVGLKAQTTIASNFTVGMNIAGSVFTNDQTNDSVTIEKTYQELAQKTLTPTSSTFFSYAGDAFARLQLKGITLGFKIKQVEPLYKSLGLFYIQNDYRNITLNTRFSLFERKLTIGATYGTQQNNLRELRLLTNERNIKSIQVNYNSGKVFSLSTNYSNFAQDQSAGLVNVEDTLRYAQVSKNLTVVPRLSFISGDKTQNITLSLVQFALDDLSAFYTEPRNTKSRIASVSYGIKWKSSGLGIKFGGNYNTTESFVSSSNRYGGTLGVSKKLDKKARISLSSTYNLRSNNGISSGTVLNTKLAISYTPQKRQRLSLNIGNLRRSFELKENRNDIRANASYNVSF